MKLTGNELKRQIIQKRIEIEPFEDRYLQPNSYDLHLDCNSFKILTSERIDYDEFGNHKPEYKIINFDTYGDWLSPNELYIFSTIERTASNYYVPMLDGCSSLARLGMVIHKTAGFGDIGFNGRWTLEIECTKFVRIYHGMRIGQVSFEVVEGLIDLYNGRYQDQIEAQGYLKTINSGILND